MTYQEAESNLILYKKLKNKVSSLKKQREILKNRLYTIKTSSSGDVVSGGEKNLSIINLIDKITEVEQKLLLEEMKAVSEMYEIGFKIDSLPYPFDMILRKYYIELKTWEKVAVECNYSFMQVMRIKKAAITEFANML